jgi:hypothetical protein
MRVRKQCDVEGCSKKFHEGTVWVPSKIVREMFSTPDSEADSYEVAKGLGLTADPPPPVGVPHMMVAWDDWPGTLDAHPAADLDVGPDGEPPTLLP